MSSYVFRQAEKKDKNASFINALESFASENRQQIYIVDRPLGDNKYFYTSDSSIIILSPKHKIIFVDFSDSIHVFETFMEDFIEDLGSVSDRYRYKNKIGRPKEWKEKIIHTEKFLPSTEIAELMKNAHLDNDKDQRISELLISLITGSINNIDLINVDTPIYPLDKVKQKIILFDGDQTRFIYQPLNKPKVTIQGLSGTGKTELLLHKLKEIYVNSEDSKVAFTCHNRILADSLRRRIPDFFNFMKVETQIKWDERLWCVHAWGSEHDVDSGIYRYICNFYNLTFNRFSKYMSFKNACELAIAELKKKDTEKHAFDYLLIDESQDFPDSFFELCGMATSKTVYIAGDIFQSIFDATIKKVVNSDFLLNKCYRTDPKTLMFAHSIGMGLFETPKLRWLEDNEWAHCGYSVDKLDYGKTYHLKREPLRRFEDITQADHESVEIIKIDGDFYKNAAFKIIEVISIILQENPTAKVEDFGIILLDTNDSTYALADTLEVLVPEKFNWAVNKAYENKRYIQEALFVSNKNNVKGLEFPFVICVTEKLHRMYSHRNALYMTLSRSFLKTYLITDNTILDKITEGLECINNNGYINTQAPEPNEIEHIHTRFNNAAPPKSLRDITDDIFHDLNIPPIYHTKLRDIVSIIYDKNEDLELTDLSKIEGIIKSNYDQISGS